MKSGIGNFGQIYKALLEFSETPLNKNGTHIINTVTTNKDY